jgi:hypothetical protein
VPIQDLASLEPYDCVYLAARAADVVRSCAGRIEAERARDLRVLVVGVFDGADAEAALEGLLALKGVDAAFARLPSAPERHPTHRAFLSRVSAALPEDEDCLRELAVRLEDLCRRVRAENVYAPLGVGGDIDRRLTHEAALQIFMSGAGRNVFLFEERPHALVPGAIRLRLAELGAQLPPAVATTLGRSPLLKYLLMTQRLRDEGPRGLVERARWAWRSLGTRSSATSWRPEKALGPRLQPLLQDAPADTAPAWRADADPRDVQRLARWGARYAKILGRTDLVERYWRLLPPREPAGTARVPRGEETAL